MKGLILSGGKGTRLRPLTFTRAKQLIPIANKPNLFYVVEDLVSAGVTDIGVIVSPETGDEIRAALSDGSRWGAKFTFLTQDAPRGLAHAVKTARAFLGDEPFVMYLGDNLLSGGIAPLVEEHRQGKADCIVLLTPVPNPQQFGVAAVDDAGRVVRLVEKPADPPSNLALVGVYLFSPAVHDVIETLQPSARGEYEITDAIQGLIDRGLRVAAHQVRGWWKDTGKPEDLLEANHLVLSQLRTDVRGTVEGSDLAGAVVVEPGARVANSRIRGPAHIAAGAVVRDSYIGPYTSIGRDVQVLHSEVEYSILLDGSEVRDLPYRLDASVLGAGVKVAGRSDGQRKHTLQLVLGDRSLVTL
ncbi:MAG TPA: glucose-1-phosphate thymidylyltransferase [Phycisphaerales bacterium]|nr:glucose-1-phosphate thymidylyltransferase [Phycisphaerales bacterium]